MKMTNTTYINADAINTVIAGLGIDTEPYKALWAEDRDGVTYICDYNTAEKALFADENECKNFVQGWANAVEYFEDND